MERKAERLYSGTSFAYRKRQPWRTTTTKGKDDGHFVIINRTSKTTAKKIAPLFGMTNANDVLFLKKNE